MEMITSKLLWLMLIFFYVQVYVFVHGNSILCADQHLSSLQGHVGKAIVKISNNIVVLSTSVWHSE